MRLLTSSSEELSDVDIAEVYRYRLGVTLRSNMIMTADGVAIGPDGLAGSISGPEDLRLLSILRAVADAVVVGAGTMRAEQYQPVRTRRSLAAMRAGLGLAPQPTLVMVTNEPKSDASRRALAEAPVRPIVICARDTGALRDVADICEFPAEGGGVDLAAAVDHLAGLGLTRLLTEGGPHLLGDLIAAELLDEYCLTVAPRVYAGGPTFRPAMGAYHPTGFHLQRAAVADSFVFLHYRRAGADSQ